MALSTKIVTRKLPEYPEICRLMKTAFPKNELYPMWLLLLLSRRKQVFFRAFYEEKDFCGILYTIEDDQYLFVLYLAVNSQIRSKGYGSQILHWLKDHTSKNIVLHIEALDPAAENAAQREKRAAFYQRNGIVDSGYTLTDEGVLLSILSSDCGRFDPISYQAMLKRFSFGLFKNEIHPAEN